jgi:hypothetical protein
MQPQAEKRPIIFISYSHRDQFIKERLRQHLNVLADLIEECWDDSGIQTGDEWHRKIDDNLNRCSVAIFLVSVDFLNSPFILKDEIPHLLERHKQGGVRIYPILIGDCAWEKVRWLRDFQVRTWGGKQMPVGRAQNTALADIAREIVEPLTSEAAVSPAVPPISTYRPVTEQRFPPPPVPETPPPHEFHPIGRWDLRLQAPSPLSMIIDLQPDGSLVVSGQFGFAAGNGMGMWSYDPFQRVLALAGQWLTTGMQFAMMVMIQGQQGAQFCGVDDAGVSVVLHRV